jgi:hypothetical protein
MAHPGLFPNGNPRSDYVAHLEPAIVEQVPALIGRDPRRLTVEQLEALGHTKHPHQAPAAPGNPHQLHRVLRRQRG